MSPVETGQVDTVPLSLPTSYLNATLSLEPVFAGVAEALDRQDIASALRLADRGRRIAPANPAGLLLYAKVLIQAGFAREALEHLTDEKNPDVLLGRATAFLELGSLEKAAHGCASLLQHFCVDAVQGLALLAGRLVRAGEAPGWIGIDRELRLVGEALTGNEVEIVGTDGMRLPVALSAHPGKLDNFLVNTAASKGTLLAKAGGRDLLGSNFAWPPNQRVAGWAAMEDDAVAGEVRVDWAPGLPVRVVVSFDGLAPRRTVWPQQDRPAPHSFLLRLDDAESEAPLIPCCGRPAGR